MASTTTPCGTGPRRPAEYAPLAALEARATAVAEEEAQLARRLATHEGTQAVHEQALTAALADGALAEQVAARRAERHAAETAAAEARRALAEVQAVRRQLAERRPAMEAEARRAVEQTFSRDYGVALAHAQRTLGSAHQAQLALLALQREAWAVFPWVPPDGRPSGYHERGELPAMAFEELCAVERVRLWLEAAERWLAAHTESQGER